MAVRRFIAVFRSNTERASFVSFLSMVANSRGVSWSMRFFFVSATATILPTT